MSGSSRSDMPSAASLASAMLYTYMSSRLSSYNPVEYGDSPLGAPSSRFSPFPSSRSDLTSEPIARSTSNPIPGTGPSSYSLRRPHRAYILLRASAGPTTAAGRQSRTSAAFVIAARRVCPRWMEARRRSERAMLDSAVRAALGRRERE